MSIQFEWDEDKNASNRKKHGISFEKPRLSSMVSFLQMNNSTWKVQNIEN